VESLIVGLYGWTDRRRNELVGSLESKPGLRRYLRCTNAVCSASMLPRSSVSRTWLPRTSDNTLSPDDLVAAYKTLLQVERGCRDMEGVLGLRPVFHYPGDRIRAHVPLCWLALLLIRVIENTTDDDTWRNVRHELNRMHLSPWTPPTATSRNAPAPVFSWLHQGPRLPPADRHRAGTGQPP